MSTPGQDRPAWYTSSYTADQGNCVELRADRDDMLVRDTKNRASGALSLPPQSWQALYRALGMSR